MSRRDPMTDPQAIEAARRIVATHTTPPKRPTIEELEKILAQPDGPPVHINPDGSIGVGESEALTVARALLALSAERAAIVEQCAKVADGLAAEAVRRSKEWLRLKDYRAADRASFTAMGSEDVATAIRSLNGGTDAG